MASYHVKIYLCSPFKTRIDLSSSDGSLSSSAMNSYLLPTASTPRPADDTEVLPQRIPGQGEIVLEAPQGETPDAGLMGWKIPMDSDGMVAASLAPRRIICRTLQWFRIQAGSPSPRGRAACADDLCPSRGIG